MSAQLEAYQHKRRHCLKLGNVTSLVAGNDVATASPFFKTTASSNRKLGRLTANIMEEMLTQHKSGTAVKRTISAKCQCLPTMCSDFIFCCYLFDLFFISYTFKRHWLTSKFSCFGATTTSSRHTTTSSRPTTTTTTTTTNWISASCQPHRVTSERSNSSHTQKHISKLTF